MVLRWAGRLLQAATLFLSCSAAMPPLGRLIAPMLFLPDTRQHNRLILSRLQPVSGAVLPLLLFLLQQGQQQCIKLLKVAFHYVQYMPQ